MHFKLTKAQALLPGADRATTVQLLIQTPLFSSAEQETYKFFEENQGELTHVKAISSLNVDDLVYDKNDIKDRWFKATVSYEGIDVKGKCIMLVNSKDASQAVEDVTYICSGNYQEFTVKSLVEIPVHDIIVPVSEEELEKEEM